MIEELELATLSGRSIASFDRAAGTWRQTWVDNFGSHFAFDGQLANDSLALRAPAPAAAGSRLHRRVWVGGGDRFEWIWDASTDGGRTWTVAWRFVGRPAR